jgi:serine protease Do
MGLVVQTLTGGTADRIGARGVSGVVVVEVEAGALAYEAGIRPGDVIVRVNETEVVDERGFDRIMGDLDRREPFRVLVWSRRGYRFLPVGADE